MKHFVIRGLLENDGCYTIDGNPLTNFTLNVGKIIRTDTRMVEYRFEVIGNNERYTLDVTLSKLNRARFLQELPVVIEDSKTFYDLLRRTVLEMIFAEDEIWYRTNRNGLQKVNEEYVFVFTNGSIRQDGFHERIYSGVGQMYLPQEAVEIKEKNKETISNLFKQFNYNPKIFYPLFLTNLMAVTNGYFKIIGEPVFMKLTLWVDGTSGSGKTELVKAVGTYAFGDKELQKCLTYATGRRKQALQNLSGSSGGVFILDDVKNERVRDRRNSVQNIVDDCIRSVFQGRLTESLDKESGQDWIDCCAVITGEYMDTEESQIARILYLRVDGFLKDENNSAALRVLQENPTWMTSACCGYIQWFLKMIEESSFPEFLKGKLKEMRDSEKLYQGVSNAERLNENHHMIEMAMVLAEKYFRDIGMFDDFLKKFHKNAGLSIKAVTEETFLLLGGEQMAVYKVMERLFSKCRIRKAVYRESSFGDTIGKYDQRYFCIDREEDFVWIDDYKKSLVKDKNEEHVLYDENPCLLIHARKFTYLFLEELQQLAAEMRLPSIITDNLSNNLLKKLRTMQIIYRKNRSESKWGRPAFEYPVYELEEYQHEGGEDHFGKYVYPYTEKHMNISFEPVIQINTNLPCIEILKERMDNEELENEDRSDWTLYEKEKVLRKRHEFILSKSLYVE